MAGIVSAGVVGGTVAAGAGAGTAAAVGGGAAAGIGGGVAAGAGGGGGLFGALSEFAPSGLGLLGSGAKAKGQSQSGANNAALNQYQAQIARRNAAIQRMRADRAEQAGIAGSDLESLRGANTMGSVVAKQGASGVLVNDGSNVDVRADVAKANKFNAANVLQNAELTSWGYRRQADNADTQAKLYDAGAIGAGQTGAAIGGTLLEGASSAPWKWLKGLGGSGNMSSADTYSSAIGQGVDPSDYAAVFGNSG